MTEIPLSRCALCVAENIRPDAAGPDVHFCVHAHSLLQIVVTRVFSLLVLPCNCRRRPVCMTVAHPISLLCSPMGFLTDEPSISSAMTCVASSANRRENFQVGLSRWLAHVPRSSCGHVRRFARVPAFKCPVVLPRWSTPISSPAFPSPLPPTTTVLAASRPCDSTGHGSRRVAVAA